MNLIYIYGLPASGKLTVATELSKITGYQIFHNHITRDLVHTLYPDNLKDHYDLVDTLRTEVFKYCSDHETNIIFTIAYHGSDHLEDNLATKRYVDSLDISKDNVFFVELQASNTELLERVSNESRKQHRKLVDREIMKSILDKSNSYSVPYDNILKIDTTDINAIDSAKLIAKQFKLII